MYEVLQDYSVQLILLLRAFVKHRASIEKECSQVPLQVLYMCVSMCVCVCVCMYVCVRACLITYSVHVSMSRYEV